MENLRHGDTRTLRVAWAVRDGQDWRRAEEVFLPSSLAGGVPVGVPDLRRPQVRRAHASDDWFPKLPEL
jgi:hypothetical protein